MRYASSKLPKLIITNEVFDLVGSGYKDKALNGMNGNDRKSGLDFSNMSDLQEVQVC